MRFQKIGLTTVVLCTVGIQQSFSIDIVTKEKMLKIPAIPHMVVVVLEIDIEMILITFGETFPPVKGNILFLRMELPVSCLETAGFSL